MNKITDINEAIKYLKKHIGKVKNIEKHKYAILYPDCDNLENCFIKTDNELIKYANEQKEAIEDDD